MHSLMCNARGKMNFMRRLKLALRHNALTLIGAPVLAIVFALGGSQAAWAKCDAGEIVIKFSHVAAAKGHPKGDAAALLAERVNEEMNGKACMQVFPNSQLYDDKKVLEAMIFGDVQLAAPSVSKLEKFTKKFRVFDLPFLFDDMAAVDKFQASPKGQELLRAMESKGFIGLGYLHNGMKHFSANRPLIAPDDAKGLKFRVQTSEVNAAMIKELGASAQKLAFKEVYGALQTGVVQGQENTWSNIYTKKFFEVQDGITETNHLVLDYILLASAEWYVGLPEDIRTQFKSIVDKVLAKRNRMSVEVNEANKKKIIEAGGYVRQLTPEQRKKWVDRMKPVWLQFEDDIGKDVIESAQTAN